MLVLLGQLCEAVSGDGMRVNVRRLCTVAAEDGFVVSKQERFLGQLRFYLDPEHSDDPKEKMMMALGNISMTRDCPRCRPECQAPTYTRQELQEGVALQATKYQDSLSHPAFLEADALRVQPGRQGAGVEAPAPRWAEDSAPASIQAGASPLRHLAAPRDQILNPRTMATGAWGIARPRSVGTAGTGGRAPRAPTKSELQIC